MRNLNVHYLPELVAMDALAGHTVVVIDVLRATTTIVTALAAGARSVVPCLTVDDARREAARLAAGECVLAGERGGLKIEGFDLGNSPAEFTGETVGRKTVVFSTTNGTKALLHAAEAAKIFVGAFVNLSAICSALADVAKVDVLCAGTDGQVTEEDVLAAGAIARRLLESGSGRLNDEARSSIDRWEQVAADPGLLVDAMKASLGGENLLAIGMGADIPLAAQIDRYNLAPRFDPVSGQVR